MSSKRVVLIGNPNSGKSSLFNELTGLRQQVSNFPGVTVEKKLGKINFSNGQAQLIDLPGTYSVYPNSQDERIVISILSNPKDPNHPDLLIYVADSLQLERHLLMFEQINDLGIPLILVLSMTDLADTAKVEIDIKAIEKRYGLPVYKISSKTKNGLPELTHGIENALENQSIFENSKKLYPFNESELALSQTIQKHFNLKNSYQALLWAHHHDWLPHLTAADRIQIKSMVGEKKFNTIRAQIDETMSRFGSFSPFLQKVQSQPNTEFGFTDRIDRVITHRFIGPLIFFALLFLIFQAIYSWSEWPMTQIENGFSWISGVVNTSLPDAWYSDLIIDGLIAGLGGVLIFIPQIFILFLLIGILEEIGYMSRAVYLFDHIMQRFGMNGRSIVALVSSGACAIPAIMSTRTISNWKERLITIMVSPLISCSARIPVYAVLIGFAVPAKQIGIFNQQGLAFMSLYILGIVAALAAAYVFKKILKSKDHSMLMIELPIYKKPSWKNVLLSVKEKVQSFVWEAGKIILLVSVVLWFAATYGPPKQMKIVEEQVLAEAQSKSLSESETSQLLASRKIEHSYAGILGKTIEPVIRPLGFDWKMGIALITSFAAREVFVGTMATIYSIGDSENTTTIRGRMAQEMRPGTNIPVYNSATSWSLLIFYVFAMQCMSTLAITKRETNSWKWPIIQLLFMTALAYFGSLITFQLLF